MTYETQLGMSQHHQWPGSPLTKLALVDANALCDPAALSRLVLEFLYQQDDWLTANFEFDDYAKTAEFKRDQDYADQLGRYLSTQLSIRIHQYETPDHSLACSAASLTQRRITEDIAKYRAELIKAPALQRGFIADQIAQLESELVVATQQTKAAHFDFCTIE